MIGTDGYSISDASRIEMGVTKRKYDSDDMFTTNVNGINGFDFYLTAFDKRLRGK